MFELFVILQKPNILRKHKKVPSLTCEKKFVRKNFLPIFGEINLRSLGRRERAHIPPPTPHIRYKIV